MSITFSATPFANEYVNLLRENDTNLAVTANTNIFATDFAVAARFPFVAPVTNFVIYVVPQAAGTLAVRRTVSNVATGQNEVLNGGTNLSVNSAYAFAILVGQNDTINFQYSVSTTFTKFILVEVP
jgi:hypothetical protein